MSNCIRVATCQFPVTGNMDANLRHICGYVRRASEQQAGIVHFPEGALPGYARLDFPSFSTFDWQKLAAHTETIQAVAKRFKTRVVLGSCRQISGKGKPRNCIHVISASGDIVGTYDKRKLHGKEALSYSKGHRALVLTIHGIKCGFLVCYDSCFPRLYASYRQQGVRLLFHSYYNARNAGAGTGLDDLILAQLRTRAADNQMWISASNSSARHSRLAACIVRPDGSVLGTKRHVGGIVIHDLPDTKLGWTYNNRD